MSTVVTVAGINYTIPAFNDAPSTGWGTNLSNFFIAVAANIASSPTFIQSVSVTTTPTTAISGKTYLITTSSLAITMQLPTPSANTWFIFKDVSNNAYTNNITIKRAGTELIDNIAADYVIGNNGAALTLMCDGTNWFTVGTAYDVVMIDSTNGNRYRVFMNGGVLSTQQI